MKITHYTAYISIDTQNLVQGIPIFMFSPENKGSSQYGVSSCDTVHELAVPYAVFPAVV